MTNRIETTIWEAHTRWLNDPTVDVNPGVLILAALKAARIAVVELPDSDGIKLQHISFGPDAECEHECCPAWVEDDDTEVSYSLDEARDLAAALLAAADAAEAGR